MSVGIREPLMCVVLVELDGVIVSDDPSRVNTKMLVVLQL